MFIYFDLGNVVAFFDRAQQCRQMGEVAGISPERVHEVVLDGRLNERYERGELSSGQFCEEFRRQTGSRVEDAPLLHAAAAIFRLNVSLIPVLGGLQDAGYRLGLLSNISPCHWEYLVGQNYWNLPGAFSVLALSYEMGALKPEARIYDLAAEMAGAAPGDIFFCDDIMGHVTAARAAGFDAVQYTSTPALVAELRGRGVRLNY